MRKLLPLLALCALLRVPGAVAAGPVDLGQGLGCLRVASLADSAGDIAAAVSAGPALVLDLRYATADAAGAARLREALAARTSRQPLLILVSPATPPAVAAALAPLPPGALTLGVAGSQPEPAIVVQQPAAADRAAHDAAQAGTPLAALVSGKIGKERYDESSLVKDFANGNREPAPPPPPDPTAPKEAAAEKPAPPVDRVLQRAVHLHRALLAIRAR